MFAKIKRILIRCPDDLQARSNDWDRDFETVNGESYLRLPIDRGNYQEIKTYNNGAPTLQRLFDSYQYQIKTYSLEIEIKVVDEREHLYQIVRQISRRSISADLRRKTPITLLDLVLPDDEDRLTSQAQNTEAVTVRMGILKDIKAGGGAVEYDSRAYIKGGFSFRFEDLTPKLE